MSKHVDPYQSHALCVNLNPGFTCRCLTGYTALDLACVGKLLVTIGLHEEINELKNDYIFLSVSSNIHFG